MAVKTKDYKVNFIEGQDDYVFSAKKKNAIYLKGLTKDDIDISSFKIINNNLLFSTLDGKNFTVSNYTSIKYIKTDIAGTNKTNLFDIISSNLVDNTTNPISKYNSKKLTVSGTNYNDIIDVSLSGYAPKGKTNIKKNKGLTIKGGNGSDNIIGTDYNDVIKGGNGFDTITGGLGADKITGGAGTTIINYTKGDGNDIINLTKGENFTLNIDGVDDIDDLKFVYANKNKDLRIYTDKNSTIEFITIKNFAKKNVVGSGKVELNLNGNIYDLRTSKDITDPNNPVDITLYKTKVTNKNFTGTYLNDGINASNAVLYKKVKQGKKKITVEKAITDSGLTIKGGAGNDSITGTKYSDKIYSNSGSDTINAGTGNNYIYFSKGDGHDIIENGDGVDTLVFAKGTKLTYNYDKYDLIIKYSTNDTVTLKDYLKGHSVLTYKIGKKEYLIKNFCKIYENKIADGNIDINSDSGITELKFPSNLNLIYEHNKTNSDLIIKYNNGSITLKDYFKIYSYSVKTINDYSIKTLIQNNLNEIYDFSNGCNISEIVSNGGSDVLKFAQETTFTYEKELSDLDLIIKYNDKSLILKDYFGLNEHSVETILVGNEYSTLSNEIKKGIDIIDSPSNNIINCNSNKQTLTFETGSGNDTVNINNGTQTLKMLYDNGNGSTDFLYTKVNNDLIITKTKTFNNVEINVPVYKDYTGKLTFSSTTPIEYQPVTVYRDNNGNLTQNSTHVESNTKVSGTYYRDSSGNITTAPSSTTTQTVQHEYKYTGWYTVVSYAKYNSNGIKLSSEIIVLPEQIGPNQVRNDLSNGYEIYTYAPFWDDVYWDGSSYNPNPSHTETITVNNTRIYGNVYRDYRGNYTTSSYSNVPNTKLSGYYKDLDGNFTTESGTILDNELLDGKFYFDKNGNIISEKEKIIDTITLKDYFESDKNKTFVQFGEDSQVNLLSNTISNNYTETLNYSDKTVNTIQYTDNSNLIIDLSDYNRRDIDFDLNGNDLYIHVATLEKEIKYTKEENIASDTFQYNEETDKYEYFYTTDKKSYIDAETNKWITTDNGTTDMYNVQNEDNVQYRKIIQTYNTTNAGNTTVSYSHMESDVDFDKSDVGTHEYVVTLYSNWGQNVYRYYIYNGTELVFQGSGSQYDIITERYDFDSSVGSFYVVTDNYSTYEQAYSSPFDYKSVPYGKHTNSYYKTENTTDLNLYVDDSNNYYYKKLNNNYVWNATENKYVLLESHEINTNLDKAFYQNITKYAYENGENSIIQNYIGDVGDVCTNLEWHSDIQLNNFINYNVTDNNGSITVKLSDDIVSIKNHDNIATLTDSENNTIISFNNNDSVVCGTDLNDNILVGNGNDIIISDAGINNLYGGAGNDTYKNTNLTNFDTIYDESGDSDSIQLTAINKDNIVLKFDIQIDDNGNIIENLSKNMYVTQISDFRTKTKGITVKDHFVNGHSIEMITTADNYMVTTTQINQLRLDIATWLYANGFESVQQIIDSNNLTNITNLIAEFKKADWQIIN